MQSARPATREQSRETFQTQKHNTCLSLSLSLKPAQSESQSEGDKNDWSTGGAGDGARPRPGHLPGLPELLGGQLRQWRSGSLSRSSYWTLGPQAVDRAELIKLQHQHKFTRKSILDSNTIYVVSMFVMNINS